VALPLAGLRPTADEAAYIVRWLAGIIASGSTIRDGIVSADERRRQEIERRQYAARQAEHYQEMQRKIDDRQALERHYSEIGAGGDLWLSAGSLGA
jgi:hypothetical protein